MIEGEQKPALEVLKELLAQLQRRRRLPAPPPFPEPRRADAQGCVALGRRLTEDMVLTAYRRGLFPMAEADGSFGWWCPDPRTILDLDAFHVPRSLRRRARRGGFEVRKDTACAEVIAACADRESTWINEEVEATYLALHAQGHVHSVETWVEGRLAGGLYGVSLGGAFMAESMFHRGRDLGKLAVVALVEHLRERGFKLLDIQYQTNATAVFRPTQIPRADYLERLRAALELPQLLLTHPVAPAASRSPSARRRLRA